MKMSGEKISKIISFGKEIEPNREIPEIEKIAGLFNRGYLSIVASPPGTGKTWLTLFLSAQLSVGGEILGGLKQNSKPQKVVLLSGETGRNIIETRIASTAWPVNEKNFIIFDALEMASNGVEYMLNTPAGKENIIAITANLKPDLLIFDTLISFHTLDENKQGEMTRVFIFLNRLAKTFDCAVVCNHHTRKRPSDSPYREQTQDDVIGSSAGIRLASSIYIIRSDEKENGSSVMTVKNAKAWDKKVPPFSYEFINVAGKTDFKIDLNVNSQWSAKSRVEKIIEELDDNAILKPKELATTLNISEKTIRKYLEDLAEEGRLKRISLNKSLAYKITVKKNV